EIASIPVYLSVLPSAATASVEIAALPRREFVVEDKHTQVTPLKTGIQIQDNEQYIINAVFAYSGKSPYQKEPNWYRWSSDWPNVDEDLYFRVGTGPWNKVNGRAILKTEDLDKGELQLFLDRKRIWEKIPPKFKDPKMLGLLPAIFKYRDLHPQFNVVITGRKVRAK
ncbi:MAG: hypothetical protein AB1540_12245, partial [Bdellovibrionota bacterium]